MWILIWLRFLPFPPTKFIRVFSVSLFLESLWCYLSTYLHWVELHLGKLFHCATLGESGVTWGRYYCKALWLQKRKLLIMSITFMGIKGTSVSHPSCEFFQQMKLWACRLVLINSALQLGIIASGHGEISVCNCFGDAFYLAFHHGWLFRALNNWEKGTSLRLCLYKTSTTSESSIVPCA